MLVPVPVFELPLMVALVASALPLRIMPLPVFELPLMVTFAPLRLDAPPRLTPAPVLDVPFRFTEPLTVEMFRITPPIPLPPAVELPLMATLPVPVIFR